MKTIKDIYTPFNFSTTRCYIIRLSVAQNGYMKIEHKLPSYIQHIKAILITSTARADKNVLGFASLNFNGQAFKSIELAVPNMKAVFDCPPPLPLDEAIEANSYVQGYYFDSSKIKAFPYIISIYLHYTPVPKD